MLKETVNANEYLVTNTENGLQKLTLKKKQNKKLSFLQENLY